MWLHLEDRGKAPSAIVGGVCKEPRAKSDTLTRIGIHEVGPLDDVDCQAVTLYVDAYIKLRQRVCGRGRGRE